jgi:hypothetical protein
MIDYLKRLFVNVAAERSIRRWESKFSKLRPSAWSEECQSMEIPNPLDCYTVVRMLCLRKALDQLGRNSMPAQIVESLVLISTRRTTNQQRRDM